MDKKTTLVQEGGFPRVGAESPALCRGLVHRFWDGFPEARGTVRLPEGPDSAGAQLLGDYDKVKAVSEGSDCRCKCLVRPLGRGACQRINEGAFRAEDFYTVETITSGPGCKCACVAPPSALNPCEGDFRLKKLREAESSDLKVGARRGFSGSSCLPGARCESGWRW